MKFLIFFLLLIIIGLGGYSTFFFITEYKPMNQKIEGFKNENRTLTELVTKLKKQVEEKMDRETGASYKKNIIEELSKISTEQDFEIRRAEKGVEISLPGLKIFNPGEEKLSEEGLLLLSKLGKILKNASSGEIKVEGHTDNTKIGGALLKQFSTNWELSAARAVNVVRYLQEKTGIPPERLAAVAYGEYRPIFPNDTEEHRQKNRRTVLVLEIPKEKGKVVRKEDKDVIEKGEEGKE